MSRLVTARRATLFSVVAFAFVSINTASAQQTTPQTDAVNAAATQSAPANPMPQTSPMQNPSVAESWGHQVSPASHLMDFAGRGPGTLLQWSYGTSFSGGPDLSEPLVTDRPDFTEASSTVGNGVLQIEAGYTYTTDSDGGETVRSNSWGEPLFRYGMFAEWFEWRLAVFPVDERSNIAGTRNSNSGVEDLYFGAKIGLTPQEGILPEMAILPQMTIPTGSNEFSSGELQPGVNWLYSWELCEDVSLAGSTQFNRAIDDTGHAYTEWAQSIATGLSLTEDVSVYGEWYALFPNSADTAKPEHYMNGGFAVLMGNDVQWDIRAGFGLNSAADDFFVGTGLSLRFH